MQSVRIRLNDGGEVELPANGCIDAGEMLFARVDGTVAGHSIGGGSAIGVAVEASRRLEPSAVERLAAIEDPEIKKRVEDWDRRNTLQLNTLDLVPDPSTPGAVPHRAGAPRAS